jgi:signal transduction histidine kinase
MHVGAAALAFPASASLVLLAVRGPSVLQGESAFPFALLAATGALGLVAWALAARREGRGGARAVPAAVDALLAGVATPLGDAAVIFDADGRVVWANDAASALSGCAADALVGRGRDALGEDLAVLMRGLERGPATGRVAIPTPAGRVQARAAAVRIPGALALDVAALRVEPPEAPPAAAPEPPFVEDADIVPEPPALRAGPAAPALPTHAALAALASELSGPVARASAAAAMLRLTLPASGDEQLGRIERELRAAEETLSMLLVPLPAPVPRAVDVDVLLTEALGQVAFAAGVRVRRVGGAAAALADAGQLRQALLHLLRLAAAAMPAGGELGVRTARRGLDMLLEISDTGAGAAAGLELALAERLVAAQGGRLERAVVSGRGEVSRMTLPAPARAGR